MKYFLTGIKGSGMCALALILKDMGHDVSGSDVSHTYFTDTKLREKDITVFEFNADNITPDLDMVILGNAFDESHEEIVRAKELGVKVSRYYEFIHDLARDYLAIAVCGTNGKTTTTGMINCVLDSKDLITLIGDGTGVGVKNPMYFLFEACEYRETFLHYYPQITLITNIEMDHPDFFADEAAVVQTYQKFADQSGELIVNLDDENIKQLKHKYIRGFGIDNDLADVNLTNLSYQPEGVEFNIIYMGTDLGNFFLPFFGPHMVYNALAAISVGLILGSDINTIIERLSNFGGVSRRFNVECLDEAKQIYLVDDYAHHPTSIKNMISALRQRFNDATLTCIFQAHTFSRVNTFKDEFVEALSAADNVIIADIFGSVRESESNITHEVMIDALGEYEVNVLKSIKEIDPDMDNQVICLLGAGDIDQLLIPPIKEMFTKE